MLHQAKIFWPNMNKIEPHFHWKSAVHRILSTMPYVLCATWYPSGTRRKSPKRAIESLMQHADWELIILWEFLGFSLTWDKMFWSEGELKKSYARQRKICLSQTNYGGSWIWGPKALTSARIWLLPRPQIMGPLKSLPLRPTPDRKPLGTKDCALLQNFSRTKRLNDKHRTMQLFSALRAQGRRTAQHFWKKRTLIHWDSKRSHSELGA